MKKVFYSAAIAGVLLAASPVQAQIHAKLTVGSRTSEGYILKRSGNEITFRQNGLSGAVGYPVDKIKEAFFDVKINGAAVKNLQENRMYEELAATIELALKPFEDYSDLPSNLARYQGILMELYYKTSDHEKTMRYASMLLNDDRDPDLQRKATIYQGLALLGSGQLEQAEALFAEQGWTAELPDDAPAEDLFITAKFLKMKQDYVKAMETVSKIIAFHSQDPDWLNPAELLCAEIYMDLARAKANPDFLNSADEVIREIKLLHKDSDEAEAAENLKLQVDALRAELEI